MSELESTTEKAIVRWVESLGGEAPKLVNVGERGWPDRTCFLPFGVIFLVETKTKTGPSRIQQERWINRLRSLGFIADIVRSLEHAQRLYEAAKRLPTSGKELDTIEALCEWAKGSGSLFRPGPWENTDIT